MSDVKFEGAALDAIKQALPEIDWATVEGDVTLSVINQKKAERLVTTEVRDREVNTAVGRFTGEGQTVFGRLLGEEAKGKQYKDLLPLLEQKWKANGDRIAELEKDGGAKGLTDAEKRELADLRKLADDQKTKITELETGLADSEKAAERKVSELLLNSELEKLYDGVPWIDDVNPYAKKGLRDEIFGKHTFRKDGEKILVFDKENNIVRNAAGTGQMEAKDLFEVSAKTAKLYKMNGAKSPEAGKTPNAAADGKALTPQAKRRIAEIEAEIERKNKMRQ